MVSWHEIVTLVLKTITNQQWQQWQRHNITKAAPPPCSYCRIHYDLIIVLICHQSNTHIHPNNMP